MQPRPTRVLTLSFLFVVAGPASAQTLRGVVLDDPTGAAVRGAAVVLLDSAGRELETSATDGDGAFRFPVPLPGPYMVMAQQLGHAPLLTPLLQVGAGGVEVELRLQPAPVSLPSIGVTVEQQRRRLRAAGFYERRDLGVGRFITEEELSRGGVDRVSEALRTEPSVKLVVDFESPTGTGQRLVFRDAQRGLEPGQGGLCFPTVVLDGERVRQSGQGGLSLDELIHPSEISAIELYPSGAGAPARWSGMDAYCGVILIWRKRSHA